MSLHVITGLPRNGKSYYCCCRIIEDLISSDRTVYTNLPVHPDFIARHVALQKHKQRNEYYLDLLDSVLMRIRLFKTFSSLSELRAFRKKNPLWCRLHRSRNRRHDDDPAADRLLFPFGWLADYWNHTKANSLFYLDECYQIWNYLDASERSKEAKERRKELQNYMRMHGHDGDDVFLISHKDRDLDQFILDTCSYRINVRNSKYWPIIPQEIIDKYWWLGWLASLRWPWQFFIIRTFIGDEKTPHRSFFKLCNYMIFKCYDSNSRPNGLKNRCYSHAKNSSGDLKRSYFRELKEWFSDSWPALLVLGILISFVYGIYTGIKGMLSPKPVKVATVQSSKPDVPVVSQNKNSVPPVEKPLKIVAVTNNSIIYDTGLTIRVGEIYRYENESFNVLSVGRYMVELEHIRTKQRFRLSTSGIR